LLIYFLSKRTFDNILCVPSIFQNKIKNLKSKAMKIQIKLGFDDLSNTDAVTQGYLYAEGVDGNPYFPGENIVAQGPIVKTKTDKLQEALAKPKSPTRTPAINAARAEWETEVTSLTKMQEIVVNSADVADDVKIEMVKSANREVVVHPVRQKYDFTAKRGANTSEVVFTAVTKDAVAHLYTWTSDLVNFTNKADPWVSASAKTTATGVPVGNELAFFHKAIFAKKRMDWEGPIFLKVL
jgi:hypothetical protein